MTKVRGLVPILLVSLLLLAGCSGEVGEPNEGVTTAQIGEAVTVDGVDYTVEEAAVAGSEQDALDELTNFGVDDFTRDLALDEGMQWLLVNVRAENRSGEERSIEGDAFQARSGDVFDLEEGTSDIATSPQTVGAGESRTLTLFFQVDEEEELNDLSLLINSQDDEAGAIVDLGQGDQPADDEPGNQ